MTIKHLVLSGGGPLGFRFLSSLEYLHDCNFWNLNDIETIYSTSIGSVIAVFFCLKYDWETLNTYLIERPWHECLKLNPKQIFESYHNKGIYDKKVFELILKPLLEAKNLTLNTTLQELYEYSNIDLHIFSFELNKFKTYEMTHLTHPNLKIIDAITRSSSIPGVFIPTFEDDCCFIDGGIMCNCPISECLRDHPNEEECLGIITSYNDITDLFMNLKVNETSSLLDYIICIFTNSMNYIRESAGNKKIKNLIRCKIDFNPLTLDIIIDCASNKEIRKQWFNDGINDAKLFLKSLELDSESQVNKSNESNNL
jgi:hypothetical protein